MSDITGACNSILTRKAKIGMITIRGNLKGTKFKSAVKTVAGVAVPKANSVAFEAARGACWMSPDELLLLLPRDEVRAALDTLSAALDGQHHLAVDVSDARDVFELRGPGSREVLGKLTPANLDPGAFGPGDIRRTRLGQVAAAFWMGEAGEVTIVCFRSFGAYLEQLLQTSIEAGPVSFY